MSDEKVKDQFQILFDDVESGGEEKAGGIETVKMIDFDSLDVEEPKHTVHEEASEPARETFHMERETQEERIRRHSYEMGDEDDDDSFNDPAPVKEKREKTKKKSDYKTESIRFLIFTIIIALLAIGAIFFILFSRGIIGGGSSKEPSSSEAPVQSSESEEDTSEEASSEEPTSTEEPTTEEPTTVEPTEQGHTEVLNNYTNLFVVKAAKLNVREAADSNAKVIATLEQNAGGNILDTQGSWYHINSGGVIGYVSSEFCLTGTEAETIAVQKAKERVVITGDAVRVRKEPNTSSDILELVRTGTLFNYLGSESGFLKVSKPNGYTGYVSDQFAKVDYYLDSAVVEEE